MFSGPRSRPSPNIKTRSQRRPPPQFRLTASRYVSSLATEKWRLPILGFHWDMVRRSKAYPVPKWSYQPALGRFTRVLDYTPPGRSVDDPTIRYSGSTGYDSEGCHDILPCDFLGAFRLCHDPSICQGKSDNAFCESR